MFIMGNFIIAMANILGVVFTVYSFIVIIAAILSIDISPLILLLIIYFLQRFLIPSLVELGYKIKEGIL